MTRPVFLAFTLITFVLGYLVPLTVMVVCYSAMLCHLYKRKRQFSNSRIPLARVTVYTLAICLFYLACMSPYWIAALYSFYLEVLDADEPTSRGGAALPAYRSVCHALHNHNYCTNKLPTRTH